MPAFRLDPRARIVALAAASPEKARTMAAALDIPRAYGSWRDLIADPEVAVVSIAVPPVLQPEIAAAAAARGKHVFLEKPLGTSLGEVRALAATIRSHGVAASVDFLFARVEAFEAAERAIAAGALGTVTRVEVRWRTLTYAHRHGTDSWKLRSGSGGGALHAFASHTFHYVEALGGPLTSLSARLMPDDARDDQLEVTGVLATGAPVTIRIDTGFAGAPEHRIELSGTRGALVLENRTPDTVSGFVLRSEGREVRMPNAAGDGRIGPVSRIAADLLDAILSGDRSSPRLDQGIRVQHLIDAARRSHESSCPVAT